MTVQDVSAIPSIVGCLSFRPTVMRGVQRAVAGSRFLFTRVRCRSTGSILTVNDIRGNSRKGVSLTNRLLSREHLLLNDKRRREVATASRFGSGRHRTWAGRRQRCGDGGVQPRNRAPTRCARWCLSGFARRFACLGRSADRHQNAQDVYCASLQHVTRESDMIPTPIDRVPTSGNR